MFLSLVITIRGTAAGSIVWPQESVWQKLNATDVVLFWCCWESKTWWAMGNLTVCPLWQDKTEHTHWSERDVCVSLLFLALPRGTPPPPPSSGDSHSIKFGNTADKGKNKHSRRVLVVWNECLAVSLNTPTMVVNFSSSRGWPQMTNLGPFNLTTRKEEYDVASWL